MTITLRITEIEEATLTDALNALGKVIHVFGNRADQSVFCAFQDIYRARHELTNQPAAYPAIHAVEAASREPKA